MHICVLLVTALSAQGASTEAPVPDAVTSAAPQAEPASQQTETTCVPECRDGRLKTPDTNESSVQTGYLVEGGVGLLLAPWRSRNVAVSLELGYIYTNALRNDDDEVFPLGSAYAGAGPRVAW